VLTANPRDLPRYEPRWMSLHTRCSASAQRRERASRNANSASQADSASPLPESVRTDRAKRIWVQRLQCVGLEQRIVVVPSTSDTTSNIPSTSDFAVLRRARGPSFRRCNGSDTSRFETRFRYSTRERSEKRLVGDIAHDIMPANSEEALRQRSLAASALLKRSGRLLEDRSACSRIETAAPRSRAKPASRTAPEAAIRTRSH
jgi:hypothetical protein